ncbi:AAA family ATPase [Allokutzneria sp. A3M-2-11 16]|uniref:BTAD domain-containing putative transcriptional regulator n=1 Tax=Allokutzneria sp. A3M-2-11 16 TaxID=2962043 RepID=UPI0020B7E9FB|nr:BTAD domain-containing putative transcriptional regulator [Allokutzneria sp. A3M-2-11 16]MCP3803836.1 AAA family ATPase [Allokutzneria sp. A3M-2-11 16]
MRFNVLGALEVVSGRSTVSLKGMRQRAVLGFLLLHANEAVPLSRLVKALWPDEVPASGRKMVQNAVSGLRFALAPKKDSSSFPVLLTRSPGYVLRIDPVHIDLFRFQEFANIGRAALENDPDRAARVLREAAALWRGPALADLVEAGVAWPELEQLEDARVSVMEDRFEAELSTGKHAEVLGELEALFEAEPHRERLCGQLMTALYRCGRHVEALQVYRRTRSALIEGLGLEPGRELRDLEQAILVHDVALRLPARDGGTASAVPKLVLAEMRPAENMAERRLVSVLAVAAVQRADADPEDVGRASLDVTAAVHAEVERAGGVVFGSAGSIVLAAFGVPRTHCDDPARAVRTALAIKDRLTRERRADLRIAVTTGEALVGNQSLVGAVVDTGVLRISAVRGGSVWMCDATAEAVREQPVPGALPFLDREHDLDQLRGVLSRTVRSRRPHLVTVLGEAGMGKDRLIGEFARSLASADVGARLLTVELPRLSEQGFPHALAQLVRGCAGIVGTDSVVQARTKLVATVRELVGAGGLADRMIDGLLAPAVFHTGTPTWAGGGESVAMLRRLVRELAAHAPLVVVMPDLHRADDRLLDFVSGLVRDVGSVPLLVIATARPELPQRRPGWSDGGRDSTTMTLAPLSDEAMTTVLDSMLDGRWTPERRAALAVRLGGNPLFAIEYARAIRNGGEVALPSVVRRTVAARVDTLPPADKAVLRDAAVLGDTVRASGVAEVGGRGADEVALSLERLERQEFLRRARTRAINGELVYVFSPELVRDVVRAQLPKAGQPHQQHRHRPATRTAEAVAAV